VPRLFASAWFPPTIRRADGSLEPLDSIELGRSSPHHVEIRCKTRSFAASTVRRSLSAADEMKAARLPIDRVQHGSVARAVTRNSPGVAGRAPPSGATAVFRRERQGRGVRWSPREGARRMARRVPPARAHLLGSLPLPLVLDLRGDV